MTDNKTHTDNDRTDTVSNQAPYLELADTFHDLPEHEQASRLLVLTFVSNLHPEFRELRSAVHRIKAAV